MSLDVSCKTTTVHISRQGSVGIVDNDDKKELEQDEGKEKKSRKPKMGRGTAVRRRK